MGGEDDRPPFEAAVTLSARGDGVFALTLAEDWIQGPGAYGGLVVALLIRALEAVLPSDRSLRSIAVSFCAPARPGDALARVHPLRAGRNVTQARAELECDGQVAAYALATYARPRRSPLEFARNTPPALPAPDALVDGPEVLYFPAFCRHFQLRQALGPAPFSGGDEPRIAGWCRPRVPTEASAALVAALLDAWAPAALGVARDRSAAASLDMSVHMLADPRALSLPNDEWYAFDATSSRAAGGCADERSAIFTADGRLLATATQLVAIFG